MAGCRGGRKKIKQEICSIEVAMKQLKTHDVSTKNEVEKTCPTKLCFVGHVTIRKCEKLLFFLFKTIPKLLFLWGWFVRSSNVKTAHNGFYFFFSRDAVINLSITD